MSCNLNIVECKESNYVFILMQSLSCNLNIVECKEA